MPLHATLVVREWELARHTVRLVVTLWRYPFMTLNSRDAETNGPGHVGICRHTVNYCVSEL